MAENAQNSNWPQNAGPSTYSLPSLTDISKARTNARQFGDGTTYALDFNVNGQNYTFVPKNVASNGGVTAGENTYLLPYFTDANNQKDFNKNAQAFDLSSNTGLANYLKNQGQSTNGYLVPSDKVSFDSNVQTQTTSTLGGSLSGLKQTGDGFSYGISGGHGDRYLTSTGEVHDPYTEYSSPFGSLGTAVSDFLNSDLGKVAMVAAAYFGGPAAVDALTSGAASTVPEAISIGTSTLPAGVTEAQLAAEEAAANASMQGVTAAQVGTGAAAAAPAFTAELPAGYTPYQAPEVTKIADLAAAPATTATDAGAAATGAAATETAADLGSKVGLQATPGTGLNLATATGDAGLQTGALGTSLADMGGAQGLTTAGATGGVLGAEGINAANAATTAGVGATAANVGTGANAIGNTLSNINTGVTAANVANAATGNTLADILPYTTGAGVISSVIGANAATSAADTQAAAAKAAIDQQQANFNTINQQQAPYRSAGYTALNDIAGLTTGKTPQYDASGNIVKDAAGNPVMTTGTGYLQHQFDASDLKNGLAPNYDFMLQQGQMANQRAGNVGGGGLSGNTLQGLQKYTQDYAGNAYQQAFNNYQTQRTGIYNTLASIAGIGQTGQTATNTAATNATNAATQLGVGSAAAQAAGQTGAANAYSNALGNVTNNYTLAALLNQGGKVTG